MSKGYLATVNEECFESKWSIGKEYQVSGKIERFKNGLLYFRNPKDMFNYVSICPTFKLLQIEDLSKVTEHYQSYSFSNHIRIVREITNPDEIMNLLGRNFSYDSSNRTLIIRNEIEIMEISIYFENGNILNRKVFYEGKPCQEYFYNENKELIMKLVFNNNLWEMFYFKHPSSNLANLKINPDGIVFTDL
jgi:hypothetical protein